MIGVEIRTSMLDIQQITCTAVEPINPPGDTAFHPMKSITSQWYRCTYEYYKPGDQIVKGAVEHYCPDGEIALLQKLCEDILKKGGE